MLRSLVGSEMCIRDRQYGMDAASMFSAAMSGSSGDQFTNMGMNVGEQMGRQVYDRTRETLSQWGFGLDAVRNYFHVDQAYVFARLRLLAFPWPIGKRKTKDWRRCYSQGEGGNNVALSPRQDENAPDLYIPSMAFITYVLAAGFWLGVEGQFTPEILGRTLTSSLIVWVLEAVITKSALYLLHDQSVPWLDVVSFAGYKYVSAVCGLAASITFGRWAYWATMLYTSAAVGYVIFKSYFEVLGGAQIAAGNNSEKVSGLLVIVAASQVMLVWYLGSI
eukprot:TRINITY_DN11857_c0_g2_i3.p1 TRINITY_DN11857_c0_g2~~TRINITY_DN11857_c0_g2_i3.p1  ORF type:complete len:322 (+),score=85.71 TRINITY_DN11857_c0_g2_i3:138-968(+)